MNHRLFLFFSKTCVFMFGCWIFAMLFHGWVKTWHTETRKINRRQWIDKFKLSCSKLLKWCHGICLTPSAKNGHKSAGSGELKCLLQLTTGICTQHEMAKATMNKHGVASRNGSFKVPSKQIVWMVSHVH